MITLKIQIFNNVLPSHIFQGKNPLYLLFTYFVSFSLFQIQQRRYFSIISNISPIFCIFINKIFYNGILIPCFLIFFQFFDKFFQHLYFRHLFLAKFFGGNIGDNVYFFILASQNYLFFELLVVVENYHILKRTLSGQVFLRTIREKLRLDED